MTRTYDSPVRRQQAEETRERIVSAGAELLHGFAVWNWRALTVTVATKPRLKVMPLLRLGAEAERTRGYAPEESLEGAELGPGDFAALQCSSARMVAAEGVFVCPILIDAPEARMGSSLKESLRPYPLRHRACHTCHAKGLSCAT